MKETTFLIVLLFAIAKLYGQDYYIIDFIGEGANPDNIKVENLTQGTSVNMDGTDVLYLLLEQSEINEIHFVSKKLTIFPNPMEQNSNIEFNNAKQGNVSIRVYSITGKQIHNYSKVLSKGSHSFYLSGYAAGSYVISVQTETELFTGKVTSVNQTESSPVLIHKAGQKSIDAIKNTELSEPILRNESVSKGNKAIVELDYNEGDQLKFIGYSEGFFNSLLYDSPNSDNTYIFQFIEQIGQCNGVTQITDPRDGNVYNTIGIGDHCWMAENLKYLPSVNMVADGSEDAAGSYYYVYDYNGTNVTEAKSTSNYYTYGVLYNWTAAMDGEASSSTNPSGIQGVCPSGWHLPSDAEWTQLTDYAGGESVAGGKLKSISGWHDNGNGTDEYGFTALPGGYRGGYGSFSFVVYNGFWWSATEDNATYSWYRSMYYLNSYADRDYFDKGAGFSVRCVKD